jgi:ParB family chromosome partitioning protein
VSAPEVVKLRLDLIEVKDRLRATDDADVARLQISISERGLLNPITVRPLRDGRYRLIAGAHRLKAAQNLLAAGLTDWAEISALVQACNEDEAELREIDENLYRIELSPYDQAEFLARRWVIWNRLNGSIRGGDRNDSKFSTLQKAAKNKNFFDETSEKLGVDATTVRLAVNRRLKTSDDVWERLKGTDAAKKGVLLDKLQKHPAALTVLDEAATLYDGSVERALRANPAKPKTDKPTEKPTVDGLLQALLVAWAQWSPAERKQFKKEVRGME